ncbi:MAG: tripartite tricarboxylate transporter permease [Proteobacteria bacterium]|nr:tripartite tricarboxylate transporter permease [Pseudomonadota bacterium]
MFEPLLHALPLVLEWHNLLSWIGGTVMGVIIGALPGISATMGISVLIPLTFGMDPLIALGMMAGIYNGAMYGGAIPAILLRIPGTPAAIATVFDGYPMAQKGQAGWALQVACSSSALGGMASAVALMTLAPPLAAVALLFGPAETFWVAMFGLASIAVLLGDQPLKGLLSACLGLLIGTVGIDQVSGHERFTFDTISLVGGLHVVVLLTGLFALPPALAMAEHAVMRGASGSQLRIGKTGRLFAGWRLLWRTWIRAAIIGIIVGIVPGTGGNVAALVSYNEAKRASRNPEEFGRGTPLGVAAAECANNADNAAAMIPALTLGVPGSVVAAVILGGLTVHGLQPGPGLFRDSADVVYGFMIQMFLTSVLLFAFGGYLGSRLFVQVLRVPPVLLVPMIIALCVIGSYAINNSMFDVYLMLFFGFLGHLLERMNYPLAPAVLGLVLGPYAETSLRLALRISGGDATVLVTRPLSLAVALLTLAILVYPLARACLGNRGKAEEGA